ncbi:MAG: DUF2156 domain-containing protein [Ruminococcaceae bacterium]|nr:DUF2156 domain-containing protein [Oscillospiraceae bacterium]
MLNFRPIQLADKEWIDPLIRKGDLKTSDMNFTNLYTWAGGFKGQVAENGDRLFLRFGFLENTPCYAFPVGTGDLREAVEALKADAAGMNAPFLMRVSEDALPELEKHYNGCFDLENSDKWNDYIYSAERLATLAGKKLHAKRNHINRFDKEHEWSFELISQDNLGECRTMCDDWFMQMGEEREMDFSGERRAIYRLFDAYNVLKPDGALIRAEGRVVAFTFGEQLSSDTYLIHFEKAYPQMQGGYTLINREFVRYIMKKYPNIKWINREEDMGLENLRKAKQSYFPDMMATKYIAAWR